MGKIAELVNQKFLGGAEREAGRVQERYAERAISQEEKALEEQRRQAELARAEYSPFREAGLRALQQQEALSGTLGPEAQQQAFAAFQESPGQRFLQQRQEQALLRNQAAIGGLGGGQVRTALQQQAMGFAQQDLANQLQRLSALSSQGYGAAGGTAQIQQDLGGQIAGTRSRIGQGLLQRGAAEASGILGEAAQHRAAQEQFYQRGKEIGDRIMSGISGGMGGF